MICRAYHQQAPNFSRFLSFKVSTQLTKVASENEGLWRFARKFLALRKNTRASSSLCAGGVPVGKLTSSQDADRDIQNLAVRQMGRASLTRFIHAAPLYADGLRLSKLAGVSAPAFWGLGS